MLSGGRGRLPRQLTRVAAITSGQPQSEQEEVLAGVRAGKYKLLYVSPERLWSQKFRSGLRGVTIDRVAIDEAHCVSQWGHSFRPECAAIPAAISDITANQESRPAILAVTATATERVRKEILEDLQMDQAGDAVVFSPDRPELPQAFDRFVGGDDIRELAMHACERGPMDELRRKDLTIGTLAVVRGARISHVPGLKTEIARHPNRG
jgi:superfamily II DNA helicase RecQ